MWVEGAVGGVADLGEWNPGAAEGGGAYTDLLCAVVPYRIILIYKFYIGRNYQSIFVRFIFH
jgi:hypothetical protein